LIRKLRAQRPGALLLDGGDTWQGSATALWTRGEDMAEASLALGVDVMTAHWEFTYGAERVRELIDWQAARAHRVRRTERSHHRFRRSGVRLLRRARGQWRAGRVIGQAFPYTPIAHPRRFVPDWTFGIQEERLQSTVREARTRGAQIVVLLSHNGMDVDLKLATRVTASTPFSAATRTTAYRPRSRCRTAAAKRSSPTPARTGSSSACSISTSRPGVSLATVTGCCRCSRIFWRPIRK
jgi:hypothetical protein